MQELIFKGNKIVTFDNNDSKTWFTSHQLSTLLGYKNDSAIRKIFNRNKDEFTDSMTERVKLTLSENLQKEVRIFSTRGAHLIGMLAKTDVAKEVRRWLLDLADKEINEHARITSQQLLVSELQNLLVKAEKKSFTEHGQKGSRLMNLRKKEKQQLKIIETQINHIAQLNIF